MIRSCRGLGTPGAERVNQRRHHGAAIRAVGFSIGGYGPLIQRSGRFELGTSITEQGRQPGLLGVGEQISSGVKCSPCAIERILFAVAVPAGGQLDTPAALIEGVAGQPNYMEGVHHRHRLG